MNGTKYGQVWVHSEEPTHTFYTSDRGLDYDLTTIDEDVARMSQKIDDCLERCDAEEGT